MSKETRYLLVSLPTNISLSNDHDEALAALRAVSTNNATTIPFSIPELKVGTLDALIQQSEELHKLEGTCEAVTNKVGDSLRNILEGDEDKLAEQKKVDNSQSGTRTDRCLKTKANQDPLINI